MARHGQSPGTRPARALALGLAALLGCAGELEPGGSAREGVGPEVAPSPSATAPVRPRGLWVLAEGSQRVLENPERLAVLLDDARALGATDLFVQVYRGGRAWFDSTLADARPWRAARDAAGRDPLEALLERAHADGFRVHAWVNALALARNRDAPILQALGTDAVLVDRFERSLLDYPGYDVPPPDRRYYRLGTPGVWLDPAAPGLAAYLSATFVELLLRYPALDGLHLDYIRYPDVLPFVPGSRFGVGLDFGYGPRSRARFRAETGLRAPLGESLRNSSRWDTWRRDRVTELVGLIAASAGVARPGVQLSAAVWTYADRGYLAQGQDWRRWLDDELLHLAVPMAYTRDDRLLRYLVEGFAGSPRGERIWIGLGSWLFARDPERAVAQLGIAREAGAVGDALFSWDSIAEAPALRAALAVPPTP